MAWNDPVLFTSNNFELQGYNPQQSFYRNGRYWHGYKWPNYIQISFSAWCQFHQHFMYQFFVRTSFFYVHVTRKSCQNVTFVQKICTFNVDEIDCRFPICVVYEASEMSLNITIGGELVLSLTESGSQYISHDVFKLGGTSTFSGHITDFNVWSRPLSAEEVKKYQHDCKVDVSKILKPDIVSWPNINLTNQTTKNKIIILQRNKICDNQLVNKSDVILIFPYEATYDAAVKKCKTMNVEMPPFESDYGLYKMLYIDKVIKMEPNCREKIWLSALLTNTSVVLKNNTQNLTVNSTEIIKVCQVLDLILNSYNFEDCNGLSCFSCQFPTNRLSFTLKGLCPELHDTKYFLAQENVLADQMVLSGVTGLTNVVYDSYAKEWNVILLKENKTIGMRKDTGTILPFGLQTWTLAYNCEATVRNLQAELKLSNVSLISLYYDTHILHAELYYTLITL